MPNWNYNLITIKAKSEEAKKQLHTFIDKHLTVSITPNWNDSLLEVNSESLIPIPEGIHKLSNMAEYVQTANGIKKNPNYDAEAERQQAVQCVKDYGYDDWYAFCVHEWGSKWGFCHCHFHDENGELVNSTNKIHKLIEKNNEIFFECECAYSPADGLMKKICELYPDIEFLCEWGEEQVTEYYGIYTYDKENGWVEKYKKEVDVDYAYDMLDRMGLLNKEEDDGYFPNHTTGLVDYDERLNADSEEYLTEDQRDGIVFGDVSDDSQLDENNMIIPEE